MNGPLSGYRVLDLTDEKATLCAKLLAEMGAEVIMVDKPESAIDRSASAFCYLNAGKCSVRLKLGDEGGKELFKRLAGKMDVLVESAPPGFMAGIGLDYPCLSAANTRLIMASITGFGQTGSYRNFKSSDLVASAMGGHVYVTGESDGAPLKPFGNQAYNSACLFAANAILLALLHRHATGKGQYIDVSAMECAAATLDHVLVRYFSEGIVSTRQGSLHWNSTFRVFPCADGYILLSLFQHWETLVEWLTSEGMAADLADSRWLEREEWLKHLDHVIEVLERWTRTHRVADLVEKGQLMGFPWAEVTDIPRLVQSPQLAARGFFADIECGGKKAMSAGPPCKLDRSPWVGGGKAPASGEGNDEVYAELGLSTPELENLRRWGVI